MDCGNEIRHLWVYHTRFQEIGSRSYLKASLSI